jgi:hypothetical protein
VLISHIFYFSVKWPNIYAYLLDGKGSELASDWIVVPLWTLEISCCKFIHLEETGPSMEPPIK